MSVNLVVLAMVALADSQAAEAAAKRCDLAGFQAAVGQIEDQAFASLKAANEAVSGAARSGPVGAAGDSEWSQYKALRGEAERLRFESAPVFAGCGQVAAASPAAADPVVPSPSSWSFISKLEGGEVSVSTGDRLSRNAPLASASTNANLEGGTAELLLGALWRQSGDDGPGWRLESNLYFRSLDIEGGMSLVTVPGGFYKPQNGVEFRELDWSAIWQRENRFGIDASIGRRFALQGIAGNLYVEPSATLSISYLQVEGREYLQYLATNGQTYLPFYEHHYTGPGAEVSLGLEVGGRVQDVAGLPGGIRWAFKTQQGLAGVDVRGEDDLLNPGNNGFLGRVNFGPDTISTWTYGLAAGFDVLPNAGVTFSVSRQRDGMITTPVSQSNRFGVTRYDIAPYLVPLDATLYSMMLDYRF